MFTKPISNYKKVHGVIVLNINPEIKKYQKQKPNWYVVSQKKVRNIYKHQHDLRRKLLQDDVKKIITSSKKEKLTFLDVGCGDGWGLKDVEKYNKKLDLYGCDYNMLRLLRAKKLVPTATIFLADVNEEMIKPNSCDIILLNHVLEHVPKDIKLLKKLYSYLAPNGYLLLGVPQEGALPYFIRDRVIEPYLMFMTDHVHFYKDTEVIKKVRSVGFKVARLDYLNYAFPHSIIDRYLRKSKSIHDFMEKLGKKVWSRMGAGALWMIAIKPNREATK